MRTKKGPQHPNIYRHKNHYENKKETTTQNAIKNIIYKIIKKRDK